MLVPRQARAMPEARLTTKQIWIAVWGAGLVCLLLGQALVRLTPIALQPITSGALSLSEGTIYVVWVVVNAYAEGYRGFQRRFSPRVVERSFYLGRYPSPLRLLLALPFVMSLFHSTKRQLMVSWILLLAIVGLVALVRLMPQPWRGIVDGGVVVGLAWGLVAIVVIFIRTAARGECADPADLPGA